MWTPIISVVINSFNGGSAIDASVQSALQQTEPVEILIVDPGSSDLATQHLLVSYQRPRTRILPVSASNRALKNLVLDQAAGDYLVFLNAGELLHPEFSKITVPAFQRDSRTALGVLASNSSSFDENDPFLALPRILIGEGRRLLIAAKAAVIAAGGFDDDAGQFAEWDLSVSLAVKGSRICTLPGSSIQSKAPTGSGVDTDWERSLDYLFSKHEKCFRENESELSVLLLSEIDELASKIPDAASRLQNALHEVPSAGASEILSLLHKRENLYRALTPATFPQAVPAEISWGDWRRLSPLSSVWGLDRGKPIDRYYIEQFLGRYSRDIKGTVLEIKDPVYTDAFGSDVQESAILDIAPENPNATIIGDLAETSALPEDRHDCFILTQTIHVIYDSESVLRNAWRTLKPGGVLLATLPCASRVDYESGLDGDHWRFTPASARRLFEGIFGQGQVQVEAFGNVMACCGFLMGIAAGELKTEELDPQDPYFPLLLGVRAVKSSYPCESMIRPDRLSNLTGNGALPAANAASLFRVIALIAAFNEGDIISSVIGHLVENGIEVYLIDNHSTDNTVEEARPWLGRGLINIESFPAKDHPAFGHFAWGEILKRKAQISREFVADWFIHHDADEFRESPFPGLNLSEAIRWVDSLGYNAVDFKVFNFQPVNDEFRPGMDPKTFFHRYEQAAEYDKVQIKCWKAGSDISLHDGGHEVRFEGRKVCPIPFILRHYPIRGQQHGFKKVFHERKDRFLESEREGGWHVQYDSIQDGDHSFVKNPASLLPFNLEKARLENLLAASAETQTAPPPPLAQPDTSAIEGFLEVANCHRIEGWVWRPEHAEIPVAVDIWDGNRLITTVQADRFRQDLVDAGKGDGKHAFSFIPPPALHNHHSRLFWVNIAGTNISLAGAPVEISCSCQGSEAKQS